MRGIALNREINPEFGISQKAAVRILTDSPDGKKEGRTRLSSPKKGGEEDFRNEGDRDERKTRRLSNEQHRANTSARAPGSTVVPLSPRALKPVIRKPRCRPGACPRRYAPRLRVSRRAHPGPSFAFEGGCPDSTRSETPRRGSHIPADLASAFHPCRTNARRCCTCSTSPPSRGC